MFFPEGQVQVFLYASPVDMRRSFDGLYALTRHHMNADPLSGHLFGFFNRRATMIKVLYFDRTGFCIWAKRLERGRFVFDWNSLARQTDYTALKMLLEGIEPRRIRKRYRHPSGTQ
jgi:transposase